MSEALLRELIEKVDALPQRIAEALKAAMVEVDEGLSDAPESDPVAACFQRHRERAGREK